MDINIINEINDILKWDIDDTSHKMYGFTKGADSLFMNSIGTGTDVYEMIEEAKIMKSFDPYTILAVSTYGWAAPLNEDGGVDCAPSKHEERRRVRLISIVDRNNGIASILHFNDTDEDVIDENGEATGHLADLLSSIFN